MRLSVTNQPNRFTRFAYILGVITTAMMIVNVALSAELSQDGLVIDSLTKHQIELKNEIRDIEQKVLGQTSLNDLYVKAQTMDYIVPTSIVTINSSRPLAYKCK